LYSHKMEKLRETLPKFCTSFHYSIDGKLAPSADEIVAVINTGPSANRIDVVFMGDGYTETERERFFDDIKRLTTDMWEGVTFKSYLPLFNVWALYRASAQSGIGVGGTPRNTAFGLYRDGTELRGIYTAKASDARSACSSTGFCDFPSLVGNDAFYGGLGGEFTISTASATSGTIVLRHEFGHNFGNVGEEYNGGSVYRGANVATSPNNVGWASWLTEPSNRTIQQSIQRLQSYAWYNLANGAYTLTLSSDGTWPRAILKFSVSGCESPGSLTVTLDGRALAWNTTGLLDRQFYTFWFSTPLSSGSHSLVFSATPPVVDQIRQLCNVEFLEYKDESQYKFSESYIGIYPTISQSGSTVYRSNHELCLMRNMSSTYFCNVCRENMWHQFLARLSLIDSFSYNVVGSSVNVTLVPLQIAQFRPVPVPGESYTVTWLKAGVEQPSLANVYRWTAPHAESVGTWTVRIQFQTPEVRVDPSGLLTDSATIVIQ